METKLETLKFIDVNDLFINIISDNITDIRTDRLNDRWVFPTLPDSHNYNNYPIVVIKTTDKRYLPESAGKFLKEEYDNDNGVYKEYYYNMVEAQCNYFVMTEKDKTYTTIFNGETYGFKNKPLNEYLTGQVIFVLQTKREELLKVLEDAGRNFEVEETFENNKYIWSSQIRFPIKYKEVWVKEYQDGELLSTYTLNKTIIEE